MRLRHGVTVQMAIGDLGTIIQGSQQPRNMAFQDIDRKRTAYLDWVATATRYLRSIFGDTEIEESLLARGYWHICNANLLPNPLGRVIDEEITFQAGLANIPNDSGGRLGDAVKRLGVLLCLAERPGSIYVLDTNALPHYTLFDQINWRDRLSVPTARLIIPLVVIDELDEKNMLGVLNFGIERARYSL